MGFCEHCEGQRFDRSRVLRALRKLRRRLRAAGSDRERSVVEEAIRAVQDLDIPHLEIEEFDDEVVH